MKTIRNQIKHLALLFASLILFQSCVVYQKTSVSLEQAAKSEVKVKVITKADETYKFHHIGFEDGKFYGEQKTTGYKNVIIPLQDNEIYKVLLKDKSTSTILSIGLGVILIGAFVAILALSTSISISPGFVGI